ncbi:unnamed protein product [Somion occarium]|uniref:Fungal-type protein kinase domain-containing protein n=2 Tax=Somion occarium TaxID=3059160 RepID=A0ABP1EAW3_9APHY
MTLFTKYKHPLPSGWTGCTYLTMTESQQPRTPSPVPDAKSFHKDGAEGIENSHMAQKPEDVDVASFMREHLTPRPAGKNHVVPHSQYRRDIQKIKSAKTEALLYAPACALLNKVSKRIYYTYTKAGNALDHADPVLFLDHHTGPPVAPGLHLRDKPDIVGVFGIKKSMAGFFNKKTISYTGVPYHCIITTGEFKPEENERAGQAVSYACQHATSRLDMPGVYALFANVEGYRIIWFDASGVVKSPFVDWDQLALLEGYIRSIYIPPNNHHLWDPTISSPVILPDAMGKGSKAHWTITYNGEEYNDCNPFFIPHAWGRRTTVFMYEGDDHDFAVIKDAYRDDARRFEEATLIKDIHSNGIFPGVVRLLDSGNVNAKDDSAIVTARPADLDNNVIHRTKKRLIMGSRGSKLYEAKSVKDILKAVYDVLEVHRALLKRRRFLHRDLSMHNVLIYPEHSKRTTEGKEFISDPPEFIDEILGESNDYDDRCRALLIDADNSASLKSELMANIATTEDIHKELALRTGTPRYIARSVASGRLLSGTRSTKDFKPMPSLKDEAKEMYVRAYGQDTYDSYEDTSERCHGGVASSWDPEDIPFIHRPDHDVESVFWLLSAVFILAKPLGKSDEPTPLFVQAWKRIQDHSIAATDYDDDRTALLDNDISRWKKVLHPDLASLAPLMFNLGDHVRPEYALLDPRPHPDHLHEAFRRLILEHIISMGDTDIALEPGISRRVASDSPAGQVRLPRPPTDLKRKADGEVPAEGHVRKSKRSRIPHPLSDGVLSAHLHDSAYVWYLED